jgi:glycosyltransferase involved in cell wall biosynthesis
MKISYFCTSPEWKGSFYRAFFLAKYLAKKGHEVWLVCPSRSKISTLITYMHNGVKIVTYPMYYSMFKFMISQPAAIMLNLMLRVVKNSDIIHTFSVSPSNLAISLFSRFLSASYLSKAKILVDWDDWWGRGGLLKDWRGSLIEITGTFIEEKTPVFADAVTVVSDVLKLRALGLGIKKVFKIPNGSNVDGIKIVPKVYAREILGLPKDRVIILHLGFTDLTQIAKKVGKSYPKALFLVVGNIPRYASLRVKRIEKLSNVKYIKGQPYGRIGLFLSASDILLLKMENEVSEAARWPIRLGDYLAAGKPIVAGDIGEVSNILRESGCGLLAKPGDSESYAEKILEMLEDSNHWEELGRRARQTAEKYSWSLIADSMENCYSKL